MTCCTMSAQLFKSHPGGQIENYAATLRLEVCRMLFYLHCLSPCNSSCDARGFMTTSGIGSTSSTAAEQHVWCWACCGSREGMFADCVLDCKWALLCDVLRGRMHCCVRASVRTTVRVPPPLAIKLQCIVSSHWEVCCEGKQTGYALELQLL